MARQYGLAVTPQIRKASTNGLTTGMRAFGKPMTTSKLVGLLVMALLAPAATVAAAERNAAPESSAFELSELPAIAPVGSRYPHLFAHGERVLMSWLQVDDTQPGRRQASLWFSSWQQGRWSLPQQIAVGDNWFVNWADFPSIAVLADGTLVAHWLQKSAPDTYAYDVRLSFSSDAGRHWSAPVSPHDDGTSTEHGFVSLLPQPNNRLSVIWLDGRASQAHHEMMQLRHAEFDASGKKLAEQVIDSDTCTCCQTSAVAIPGGVAVAYRDHAANEIRDIAWLRLQNQQWHAPELVHADGWEIAGCPVNGPALGAVDKQVAAAWYTGAQQIPRVNVAFAANATSSFQQPLRIDDGAPLGRVALAMPRAHQVIVAWLERVADEQADIRVRQIRYDAKSSGQEKPVYHAGKSLTVASTSLARSSGFPRLALQGNDLFVAWTDSRNLDQPQVRVARIDWRKLDH